MSGMAHMTGGPLNGQAVELHSSQEHNGEYGVLTGRNRKPREWAPAYVRDSSGQ
ncbi:hypothetical protein [Streptomyces sp. NPDC049916]|uniref:hypothetical protein n=1 Tax=Streptomyces sp. NPDC049916 TaxID=3155156 RepID=UPI003436222A